MTVTTNPVVTGIPVAATVANARVTTNATVTGVPDTPDGINSTTVDTNPSVSGKYELDILLRSFDLPLQTSLVPSRSMGSGTPTFTRATTAYQTDFEGKLNLVPSGAARMQGARVVNNAFTATEALDGASWQKLAGGSGSIPVVTAGFTAPDGSATAFRVQLDRGATDNTPTVNYSRLYQSEPVPKQSPLATTYIRSNSGSAYVITLLVHNTRVVVTIPADTTWRRFSTGVVAIGGAGGGNASIAALEGGAGNSQTADILVWHPMREETVGQANVNPSEYVPALATANPDSGAIGVRYFPTLNGNTVASNVVTEATGAAINSSEAACAGGVTAGVVDASGPTGFLAEGARTNAILQSNTLGTTWTVSNAADMEAVAADAYVSVDGTTTMDKLQPKATTAVHSLDQAFTFTAAKYTFAVDLRYVPATPQRWVALILNDGTTTWGASFDLLNGVVGAVSAGATSTIEATALANVYRVSVTNTANAAAAAGTVKISLNATDTATLESAARAGTETLGAGAVQLEIGTFASTPVTTTTVAVARNADVLTYASAGNISGTQGAAYAEISVPVSALQQTILGSASGDVLYIRAATQALSLYDGAQRSGNVVTQNPALVQKVASKWGGSSSYTFIAGVASSDLGFDGDLNLLTALMIGAENSLLQPYGTIRNVRIYPKPLSASRLQGMTS